MTSGHDIKRKLLWLRPDVRKHMALVCFVHISNSKRANFERILSCCFYVSNIMPFVKKLFHMINSFLVNFQKSNYVDQHEYWLGKSQHTESISRKRVIIKVKANYDYRVLFISWNLEQIYPRLSMCIRTSHHFILKYGASCISTELRNLEEKRCKPKRKQELALIIILIRTYLKTIAKSNPP